MGRKKGKKEKYDSVTCWWCLCEIVSYLAWVRYSGRFLYIQYMSYVGNMMHVLVSSSRRLFWLLEGCFEYLSRAYACYCNTYMAQVDANFGSPCSRMSNWPSLALWFPQLVLGEACMQYMCTRLTTILDPDPCYITYLTASSLSLGPYSVIHSLHPCSEYSEEFVIKGNPKSI